MSSELAIELKGLRKVYGTHFQRRRVTAVDGLDLEVASGQIFGFLGPNGAGKTTTIRMLMGLIAPSEGSVKIFGHEIPSREARARVGFLPEAPYFYAYLTLDELIDLTGRLFNLSRAERRRRADELIELVGMNHARKKPLKSYSKGMLQRAGIAQALVNDPDLVVFDEPMSGLDPVGRKEVRDIIYSLRDQGKTLFFSSHILADVEMVADRIAIITAGKLRDVGTLRELVGDAVRHTDITLRADDNFDPGGGEIAEAILESRRVHGELQVRLAADASIEQFLDHAREKGARVVAVVPYHQTLEDVFVREAQEQSA